MIVFWNQVYNKANNHRANVVFHCFKYLLWKYKVCFIVIYLSRAEMYSVELALVFKL